MAGSEFLFYLLLNSFNLYEPVSSFIKRINDEVTSMNKLQGKKKRERDL